MAVNFIRIQEKIEAFLKEHAKWKHLSHYDKNTFGLYRNLGFNSIKELSLEQNILKIEYRYTVPSSDGETYSSIDRVFIPFEFLEFDLDVLLDKYKQYNIERVEAAKTIFDIYDKISTYNLALYKIKEACEECRIIYEDIPEFQKKTQDVDNLESEKKKLEDDFKTKYIFAYDRIYSHLYFEGEYKDSFL